MMSGRMTNPILESALDAVVGMDRFGRITKPIGIGSLPKVVAGFLASSRGAP